MNSATIQAILSGIVIAAVAWMARSVSQLGIDVATIKTTLVGQSGQNGLNSEVGKLRERNDIHGDAIHAMQGKHELLAQRVDTLERGS